MLKKLALALALLIPMAASAEVAKFTWNPVNDSRVAKYVLSWGNATGTYDKGSVTVDAPTVIATTPDLGVDVFYFAVKACIADLSLCSNWSNEVSVDFRGAIQPPDGFMLDSIIPAGALQTALTTPTGAADLTAEGLADWAHWGEVTASSVDRKAGVTGQIGDPTAIGGAFGRYTDTVRLSYIWSDGTPTESATTQAGLYIAGLDKGFEFQVPADTSVRTLVVYLGGFKARGRIEVSLSDGSAPAFVQTVEDLSTAFDRRLELSYRAGSAGQTLTVRYLQETSTGNITLQAATLL